MCETCDVRRATCDVLRASRAEPHDRWVLGDEPYVSLHFLGSEQYAKK
jgi:hypothetical protein